MRVKKTSNDRVIIALVTFIFILCAPASAGVLQHPLQIKAEVSNGGYVKDTCSMPVTVEITNDGNDFNGKLSLSYRRNYKGGPDNYYQDIRIPRNGKKRYFLYIPHVRYVSSNFEVRVTRGNDYVKQPVSPRRANPGDLLFVMLNRQRGGMAYLSGFTNLILGSGAINVTYPDVSILPVHWKGYDSIDYLVINDFPSLGADRNREKAIIDYVTYGGTLVISTNLDPNEYNGSLLKEYLPLSPTRTVPVPIADGAVFVNQAPLLIDGKAQGEVLLQTGNLPLLIRRSLGQGQIYFITADISKKPFKEDYEQYTLWHNIDKDRKARKTVAGQFNLQIEDVLNSLPEASATRFDIIFWILLFYILLVGPANYFYLKKKDKLLMLFVTVPVIAVTFSIVMFLIGYSTKGSSILLRNFSVVHVDTGSRGTKVESVFSLFSPSHYDYDLTLKNSDSTAWESGSYNPPTTRVKEQDSLIIEDQRIPMWSARLYRSQRCFQQQGTVEMNIKVTGNRFNGSITNNTGKTIRDCILYRDGYLSRKFDLPPGIKQLNEPVEVSGVYTSRMIQKNMVSQYKLQPARLEKLPRDERTTEQVRVAAINLLAKTSLPRQGQGILLGWSNEDINGVKLNRMGSKHLNINLYIVR